MSILPEDNLDRSETKMDGFLEALTQPRKKPDTPSSRWFSLTVFIYFLYTPGEVSWSTGGEGGGGGWPSLLQKMSVWQCGIHTGEMSHLLCHRSRGSPARGVFISVINTKAPFCLKNTSLGDTVRWTSHCFCTAQKPPSPTPTPPSHLWGFIKAHGCP